MITDDRIQACDQGGGDIGRVGHHQIELPPPGLHPSPPVALVQADHRLQTKAAEILRRLSQGLIAAIHRQPARPRQGAGQGQGHTTGAGAQISPEKRLDLPLARRRVVARATVTRATAGSAGDQADSGPAWLRLGQQCCGQAGQGQIHQTFRLLPGDQHPGSHPQLQIPPGAEAHQVLQWFGRLQMATPDGFKVLAAALQTDGTAGIKPQPLQNRPTHPPRQIEQPVQIIGDAPLGEQLTPPDQQHLTQQALTRVRVQRRAGTRSSSQCRGQRNHGVQPRQTPAVPEPLPAASAGQARP